MLTLHDLTNLPEYLTYDDVLLLPNYSEVVPANTDTTALLTNTISITIPIVASPMDTVCEARLAIALGKLGGYGIIHRNFSVEDQAEQVTKVLAAGFAVGAAVGVGQDFDERVSALHKAGIKEVCIDSAHGHTKNVIEATRKIKQTYPNLEIIAGNVATYEGAKALYEAGADAIKVGMGPGSICTTRIMSGMGVSQLTAVAECVRAAQEAGKRLIADGGIKTSGDIVKALAAGADTVMLGSLLAGTDESPGEIIEVQGKLFKTYRGMGSVGAMKKGSDARYSQKWQKGKTEKLVAEGVEGLVAHRGNLSAHIHQLIGGLQAGMGYLGAANLTQLRKKARFIKISSSTLMESKPHNIVLK
ncbi:MAG: IMP dehydrogenase [Patescibacteria group bacterium]